MSLTRDWCACLINRGYSWVHHYSILLSGDLGVSLIHLLVDPLLEGIASKCVDHVGNIGSWKFKNFPLNKRQGIHNVSWSTLGPVQLILYGEAIEKRHWDYSDVSLFNHASPTRTEVFQMKDGYALVVGEISTNFTGHEPEHLVFTGKFWRKSRCIDGHVLVVHLSLALAHNLVHLLLIHILLLIKIKIIIF